MNCAYHADVPNVAFCIRCGRALCDQCVRNVRGSVYCETCLADAVEGGKTGAPRLVKSEVGEVKNRELWGGVLLIVIGGICLLGNLDVFDIARITRFWPVLLVFLGVWLLMKRRGRAE